MQFSEFPIERAASNRSLCQEKAIMHHISSWGPDGEQQKLKITQLEGNVTVGQFDRRNRLVAANMQKQLVLSDLSIGKNIQLKEHTGAINDIKFTCFDRFIITGDADASVNIYDASSGILIKSFGKLCI